MAQGLERRDRLARQQLNAKARGPRAEQSLDPGVQSLEPEARLVRSRSGVFEEGQEICHFLPGQLLRQSRRHQRDGARLHIGDVLAQDPGFFTRARNEDHLVEQSLRSNAANFARRGGHDDGLVAASETRTWKDEASRRSARCESGQCASDPARPARPHSQRYDRTCNQPWGY